jgi:hypothetical protein
MMDYPYAFEYAGYEDSTDPKRSILLDARDWYRSRSMIAGILAGVMLESTEMVLFPKPSTLCILFSLATSYWFGLLILFSLFLSGVTLSKYSNFPRIQVIFYCLALMAVTVLCSISEKPPDLPNKQEYTETERMLVYTAMSSIIFVKYMCGWLALATIILFFTTRSPSYLSFRRFFSLLRNVIVFVGACGIGVNICLYIACFIGFIPAVYDVTGFVSMIMCRLVLIVAVWMQEKIVFPEVEPTKSAKTEEGGDTLEYSFIC